MPGVVGAIASFLAANSGAIAAGSSLLGAGLEAANALGGAPAAAQPQGPTPQQQLQARQQTAAAIARQFPNLQALVGDSLSPTYLEKQASLEAGVPGSANAAQDAWLQYLGSLGLGQSGLTGGL